MLNDLARLALPPAYRLVITVNPPDHDPKMGPAIDQIAVELRLAESDVMILRVTSPIVLFDASLVRGVIEQALRPRIAPREEDMTHEVQISCGPCGKTFHTFRATAQQAAAAARTHARIRCAACEQFQTVTVNGEPAP